MVLEPLRRTEAPAMPYWIGKTWLTREDLDREAEAIGKLRFDPPEPWWRRVFRW